MNEQKLQQIIIKAARQITPDESVPYAFEKRIMQGLRKVSEVDVLGLWSRMLWRAAFPSVMVMVLTGAWVQYSSSEQNTVEMDMPDIEYAVLVPVDLSSEENW
ncbi:MAG: hypothetical protein ACO1QB_09005 [Verrucomicrobiales bacterium]